MSKLVRNNRKPDNIFWHPLSLNVHFVHIRVRPLANAMLNIHPPPIDKAGMSRAIGGVATWSGDSVPFL